MSEIGDRIKEFRKWLRVSQDDFVLDIDITRSHLSKIETGVAIPSDKVIRYISKKYMVNEEWLREGKGYVRDDGFEITTEMLHNFSQESPSPMKISPLELCSRQLKFAISTLDKNIIQFNRFESANHKEFTRDFKKTKSFKIIRIYKNILIDLKALLSVELNNIDNNNADINLTQFPFTTDLEKAILNILRSIDKDSLKDFYALLAAKGNRLDKEKRDNIIKDIREIQKAAK